jgi:galactokinase
MTTWSAPGRVNLIGEHVDYNGGPVLPFALDLRTTVAIGPRPDARTLVTSQGLGTSELPAVLRPGEVGGWARYVAAALWVFADAVRPVPEGLDIEISSTVPVGAGLSSSAAVGCAVLCVLDDIAGSRLTREEIASLALRAEREFVGVPVGPMDQLAAMLSLPDHALLIETRTLDTEHVPLALASAGLALLVINTRVRHALDDGAYADRQRACAAAAAAIGVGSLADASLAQVLELSEPVVRRRAHHVVTEVRRVRETVALLKAGRATEIGGLLTASHQSLAEDFEVSCAELDTAVAAALAAGALGARMTGGGFGGCAIALCRSRDASGVRAAVDGAFAAAGFPAPDSWSATPAAGAQRSRR